MSASREERDQQRLRYIHESITRIEQYTREGEAAFLNDHMVQDAVLRRLETLSDATHQLPDSIKQRHPDIPWAQIRRFRNVAAHDYESLDLRRIWNVVVSDLSPLKSAIEAEIRAGRAHGRAGAERHLPSDSR